jgi:hypothetical protein
MIAGFISTIQRNGRFTAGRTYFDMDTLQQTITDALVDDRKKAEEDLRTSERNLS